MRKISVLSQVWVLVCLCSMAISQAVPEKAGTPTSIGPSSFVVSGPYRYQNLQIFLLHDKERSAAKVPTTLGEAMKNGAVKVLETDSVNRLAIENLSDDEVFVQSGDIVKGGKQDRVLALDLILPPHSGEIAISAFCVEHDRWSRRGDEELAKFSESSQVLNHKDLKLAAKSSKSQTEVWAKVAESKNKIASNVVAISGLGGGNGGGRSGASLAGAPPGLASITVDGASSATSESYSLRSSSLQLTLENKAVMATADRYIKSLLGIVEGKTDVVGFAFAINGKVNSADAYNSPKLFLSLWERMLRAAALEAIADFDSKSAAEGLPPATISMFISDAERGPARNQVVTKNTSSVMVENARSLLFETRIAPENSNWIHRNYIAK